MPLLNSVCLFCYRDRSSLPFDVNGSSETGLKGKGNLDKFVELAQRWLETNLPLHSNGNGAKEKEKLESKAKEGFAACEDCLFAVNSFCKLYHEWKCLELEVEWRLSKLCNVIKQADRVHSRKQRLETNFKGSEEGRKVIKNATKFRTEFKRKCAQRHLKSSPRVVLRRTNGKRHTKTVTKQEAPNNNVEHQIVVETNTQKLCLGWISTFVAVLLLGNWDQESTGKIQNNCDLQIFDSDDAEVVASQLKGERSAFPSPCEISSLSELEDEADCSSNQIVSLVPLENETKLDIGSDWRRFETNTSAFTITPSLNIKPKKRKYVESTLRNPKKTLRRRELNEHVALFKCFRCNRNFTSLNHLHRHRRSFTHVSAMQKVVTKSGGGLRKNKSNLREFQITATSTSADDMNVGILRPLRTTYKQNLNRNDEDTDTDNRGRSFNEDEASSSEFEDGSSTESDSSSSSSDELSSDCSDTSTSITKHNKRRPKLRKLEHSFVCSVSPCQESFKFEEELELHNKYHGCFLCSFCNETLHYAPDLARHELSHSEREIAGRNKKRRDKNEKYHCARCNYAACGWHNYVSHHLTNHLNLPAQKSMCKICKKWLRKKSVKPHMLAYHKDSESHKCNECSAYFAKPHQLDDHKMKKHLPIKNELLYFCEVESCKKGFAKEHELESHKRLHGSFSCKFCSVVETYAQNLALHETAVHSKSKSGNGKLERKYNCARCKVSTNHMSSFVSHYLRAHLFPKSCTICQKTLLAENSDFHFQGHHNTSNVDLKEIKKCTKCPAYFLKETQLKSHTRKLHPPSPKPFPCKMNLCSENFDFEEELEAHKKQHGNFSCKYCSVVKTYAPNLAVHESSHSQRKGKSSIKWHCSRCEFRCREKNQHVHHFLTRHLQLPHLIVCRICRKFVTKTSIFLHNRLFHRTDGLDRSLIQKCEQCPAYFLKNYQLTAHIKQIHDKKRSVTIPKAISFRSRLHCDAPVKCQRFFETMEQLENHRKLHGTFPCSTCNDVFKYAPKLALHEVSRISTSIEQFKKRFQRWKSFTCPKCKVIVVSKFRYINHYLITHMKLPPEGLTCPDCSDSFVNNALLDAHKSRFHTTEGENGAIVKCNQCSATFGKNFYLILHKQKFHAEDNLTCVDCGRKMSSKQSLRLHRIKVHKKNEEEYSFRCDVPGCERRFENETRLEWHQHHTHNCKGVLDNSLVCHECGKKCTTKTAFTRHLRAHAHFNSRIEEKFVCEKCGKFFKTKAMLQIHQLFHGGPKSWEYACLFCEKKSATKEIFMDHLRTHTNEKPYSCEYCGEEYAHMHNLRNHKNRKHDANDRPKVITHGSLHPLCYVN